MNIDSQLQTDTPRSVPLWHHMRCCDIGVSVYLYMCKLECVLCFEVPRISVGPMRSLGAEVYSQEKKKKKEKKRSGSRKIKTGAGSLLSSPMAIFDNGGRDGLKRREREPEVGECKCKMASIVPILLLCLLFVLRYHFELGGGKENYFSRCKEGGEEKEHLLHEGEGGDGKREEKREERKVAFFVFSSMPSYVWYHRRVRA